MSKIISGVLYALLTGLVWGLIFTGPPTVLEYPTILQSMGRYPALGLIALPIIWLRHAHPCQLVRKNWVAVLILTMMRSLVYYVCLISAIQRTGAPVSTVTIGTLPVVIPVFANLLYNQRNGRLSWWHLSPALVLIGIGLLCANISELNQGLPDFSGWRYGPGIALAFVLMVCWVWYALRNARWLREDPDKHPMIWAIAQVLVALPISLLGYITACLWLNEQTSDFTLPFGLYPGVSIGLMITITVLCSRVGASRWNVVSQKLPTAILGPLIAFETPVGLSYIFILREKFPSLLTVSGIAPLMAGVVIAVRAKPQKPSVVVVLQS